MSPAFASLHFLRPHWLWALLALPLLWWWWHARQRRASAWREAVDAHLLPHLLEHGGRSARGAWWLGALGYALAVFALAGPSWRQDEQPLWRTQAPLVVALDLSGAIAAGDLPPSRLLQARAKLASLLRERRGGQVALVVYAGDAFTVAPLTDDADNVALFLDALEPSVMPVDGQDAARAIEWSARLMRRAGFPRGEILLLTDQADAAARAAAAKAAGAGFHVSALGLGTADGAVYRTADGRIGRARLDAASLRALALAGHGRYAPLTADDGDLRALGVLDPQQAVLGEGAQGKRRLAWRDEGYWLLPPLMLLGLLAFRRGSAVAALALCVLLPLSQSARAADGSLWRRPDQQRHARIAKGAEAYRKGDFATAERAFSGIDSPDAFYNRGNALAKQGRYDEAIAAYDEALQRRPGMEDAIANRRAVEAARKRQTQDQQDRKNQKNRRQDDSGQNRQREQGQGNQDESPVQGQQDPSDPQSDDRSKGRPQARSQQQDRQDPPPKPQDPQDQQAADAAQRERMRQAKQQQPKAGEGDPPGERQQAETAQQRERRQATEAWLRRVPDDPGGLLRAKFRIEYARRQREGR